MSGCGFDIGVLTNITHEHLDFHGSYEAYRAAKARLFTMLAKRRKKIAAIRAWRCSTGTIRPYEYLSAGDGGAAGVLRF